MKTITLNNNQNTITIPTADFGAHIAASYSDRSVEADPHYIDAVYETEDGRVGPIMFTTMHCVNHLQLKDNGEINISAWSFAGNVYPTMLGNVGVELHFESSKQTLPKYIHTFDSEAELKSFLESKAATVVA